MAAAFFGVIAQNANWTVKAIRWNAFGISHSLESKITSKEEKKMAGKKKKKKKKNAFKFQLPLDIWMALARMHFHN